MFDLHPEKDESTLKSAQKAAFPADFLSLSKCNNFDGFLLKLYFFRNYNIDKK